MDQERSTPVPRLRNVGVALQGGGSHGAFTWGALDRLLEEKTIAFDAVSGASAGTMNAVLLASGLAQGGPDEARARLERFWRKVSDAGRPSRLAPGNAPSSRSGGRRGGRRWPWVPR